MKRYQSNLVTAVFVVVLLLTVQYGIADNIKLNPIKPTTKSEVLTDEQQGILAVRTIKASIVNIVGVTKQSPASTSTSASIGVTAAPSQVSGTGFVLEADGLIVSNNHVVEDANMDYTVIMNDGTEYPAKILNLDKFDDIALLQIDAKGLTPAVLGNSDELETGQSVFAIGNSLGKYQNSVTRGVVSALGRAVGVDPQVARLHNLIQTDAAINPGNSGGPLINLAGQVVGMDTLIDTGGSGLGFAVSINTVKDAVEQLKAFGKVSRPFLGVQFLDIDPAVQITKKLSVSNGALIVKVLPDTPAALAGLMEGDVITAIGNITLNQNQSLDDLVGKFGAGNQITLKILRNGKNIEIPVVLGQQQ